MQVVKGCILKDSEKDARNFRASFNFVLYRNKRGKCISHYPRFRRI